MAKFYMEDEEIRRDYLRAKDRDKQLEILADMNLVNRATMRNKLIELGLIDGEPEKIPEPETKRSRASDKINEAEARKLVENDVPDEQIAKHFGVGAETFRAWRRSKGIMRYPMKKKDRKTVKEFQKTEGKNTMDENTMPAAAPTCCQPAKPVDVWKDEEELAKEMPVTVAADENGLTVEKMGSLFAMLNKLHEDVRVTVGGKTVRGVLVNLRFDGKSVDEPADMSVELEV